MSVLNTIKWMEVFPRQQYFMLEGGKPFQCNRGKTNLPHHPFIRIDRHQQSLGQALHSDVHYLGQIGSNSLNWLWVYTEMIRSWPSQRFTYYYFMVIRSWENTFPSVYRVLLSVWNLLSSNCHVLFSIPTLHQKVKQICRRLLFAPRNYYCQRTA